MKIDYSHLNRAEYEVIYDYNTQEFQTDCNDNDLLEVLNEVKTNYYSERVFVNDLKNLLLEVYDKPDEKVRVEGEITFSKDNIRKLILRGRYCNFKNIFYGILIDYTNFELLRKKTIHSEKLVSLGAFSAGIAHDFNNQFMVILGSCELIKKQILDERLSLYLNCIEESSKTCSSLINKLLAFSEQTNIYKYKFDFMDCLGQTISMLKHTICSNVELIVSEADKKSLIYGNFSLIQSVISSLVENAVDSIDSKGVIVVNTFVKQFDNVPKEAIAERFVPGKYICLSVIDTGKGMSDDLLIRIFDPYFTTKEIGSGRGLGLSVVLTTVMNHKGFIIVKSIEGSGTCFSVHLPLIEDEDNK